MEIAEVRDASGEQRKIVAQERVGVRRRARGGEQPRIVGLASADEHTDGHAEKKVRPKGEAVTDDWLKNLANLPDLKRLEISGTAISDGGLASLRNLKSLERRYPGLDRVSVSLSVGVPKSVCLEQLEWFGKEVMPEFQKVKVAEPAFAN